MSSSSHVRFGDFPHYFFNYLFLYPCSTHSFSYLFISCCYFLLSPLLLLFLYILKVSLFFAFGVFVFYGFGFFCLFLSVFSVFLLLPFKLFIYLFIYLFCIFRNLSKINI